MWQLYWLLRVSEVLCTVAYGVPGLVAIFHMDCIYGCHGGIRPVLNHGPLSRGIKSDPTNWPVTWLRPPCWRRARLVDRQLHGNDVSRQSRQSLLSSLSGELRHRLRHRMNATSVGVGGVVADSNWLVGIKLVKPGRGEISGCVTRRSCQSLVLKMDSSNIKIISSVQTRSFFALSRFHRAKLDSAVSVLWQARSALHLSNGYQVWSPIDRRQVPSPWQYILLSLIIFSHYLFQQVMNSRFRGRMLCIVIQMLIVFLQEFSIWCFRSRAYGA